MALTHAKTDEQKDSMRNNGRAVVIQRSLPL